MLIIRKCKILIKIYIFDLPVEGRGGTAGESPDGYRYQPSHTFTTIMSSISEEANKLADFILFTQRSCILNLSSELNEGKVSYPQFFLLTYLASEDFLSMSSIAQKMGHSTAAATGMVDKLQEMGYLKRMSAAKDRRKIMVAITQEGRDLVARMRQNIVRDLAALMAGADPDARQTLADTGKSIRKRRLA